MSKKEPGLSLLDIAPLCATVKVGDQDMNVYGLSASSIVGLFQRFPEMQSWFKGVTKIDLQRLIAEAPDTISAVIAASCGHYGNEAAEEMAGRLTVEQQLDVLEAMFKLTFKEGFGPFVRRIVNLANVAQSANSTRAPLTKSPQASNPSSQPDTIPVPSGT